MRPPGPLEGCCRAHCRIVLKESGAATYDRYEVIGWRKPMRHNAHLPGAYWYSNDPRIVFACTVQQAAAIVPRARAAIAAYPHHERGSYRLWPGPNSNTFVAWLMREVPEINIALPPAIGKDFVANGDWLAPTPINTGWQISIDGYAGAALAWREGVEVHLLDQTLGISPFAATVNLPGIENLSPLSSGGNNCH